MPINIFGDQPLTDAQLAYAWGPIVEYNTIDQEVFSGSVSGELWKGFGFGPLVAAFGAEIRNEELQNDVNEEIPEARRIDIAAQYGDAFGGKVDVTEAFLELELPLLANKPGAQLLSINTAYRSATYETTDTDRGQGTSEQDMDSWKVSLIWDPISWLRIRGSKSHDVRAAAFRELYWQLTQPASATGFGVQTNPWRPNLGFFGSQNDPTTLIISGDVGLKPERAETTTIGFVITPGGAGEGFRFSADLWDITIRDGIQGGGNAQRTIQNCYINAELCDLITFVNNNPADPAYRQDMIDVRAPAFNARQYDAQGIDFAADYSRSVGEGMLLIRLADVARARDHRQNSADDSGRRRDGPRHRGPDRRSPRLLRGLGGLAGLLAQPRRELCAQRLHDHGSRPVRIRGTNGSRNPEDRSRRARLQRQSRRQHVDADGREPLHDESDGLLSVRRQSARQHGVVPVDQ